jgi:outer membrane protein TolC
LINKRPDVRKAERELAAACEEIGVAYANLYPRLSLRGFIGTFKGSAWFAGPDLLFPLLNSRAVTQDIELNKIKAEQALYNYQKIVYAALEETENALTFLNNEKERYNNLAKARESHMTTQKLIFDLYQRGVKDFMAVETSTRALITAEDAALQSQINLLTYYIALQKALAN